MSVTYIDTGYRPRPLQDIISRTITTSSGCMEWLGARQVSRGIKRYGQKRVDGKLFFVHRLVAEIIYPEFRSSDTVMHSCDNMACVNPAHLSLGTRSDNERDKVRKGRHHNSKKEKCNRGHLLGGENLVLRKDGGRECRECRNSYRRRLSGRD